MRSEKAPSISARLAARLKLKARRIREKLEKDPLRGHERAQIKDAENRRHQVYLLLEEPSSGPWAFAIGSTLMMLIIVSTACCMAETVPQLETPNWKVFFFVMEVIIVIVFTIEYILRFWATPLSKLEFVRQPLNVIDLLSILPFYVLLIVELFVSTSSNIDSAIRLLRTFRLLRLVRLAKFSGELQFMVHGLLRSRNALLLLLFALSVLCLIFASFIWMVERGTWDKKMKCYVRSGEVHFSGCSPFGSVPEALWWSLVTLSTVGFGDAFPIGLGGRIVSSFAQVFAILCVAIPTAVLAVEFAQHFKERKDEEKAAATARKMLNRTRDELILNQRMVSFMNVTTEIDDLLSHLKYLTAALDEHHRTNQMLIPTLSIYQSQVVVNAQNMKRFVQHATRELLA